MHKLPDIAQLRLVYSYNQCTGEFKRISGFGPKKVGHKSGEGYLSINRFGQRICLHRLAWAFVTDKWPDGDIDHINGIRCDNRIINLRDVPHQINLQNQRNPSKRNTSGFLGVVRHHNKWRAQITVNKKPITLGRFDSTEEAHEAYLMAKRQLHAGCTI